MLTHHHFDDVKHITILPHVMMIRMSFTACVLLKQDFWNHPQGDIDDETVLYRFLECFQFPSFYRILVTPNGVHDGVENHIVALPFRISSLDKDIRLFMYASRFPVEREAKFAALYTPEDILMYNWKSKKFVDRELID